MKYLLCLFFLAASSLTFAQDVPYSFGQTTYRELNQSVYDRDTTADGVILKEWGHSYVESFNNFNLIHRYYVKIKILKTNGLERANITIPLYRNNNKVEILRNVRASSFTMVNGSMKETKLATKDIFTEDYENGSLKKFTIPNVNVGSVIEYEYELETPFFTMNFKPWEFQAPIPKVVSEYWATIPANYRYNISLRGFLKLTKDESEIKKGCFSVGGGVADCVRYRWTMENVPAFVEEEYMTSKKNFISAIKFELIQIEYFDGRKDRVTKEWKDADQELRIHEGFGSQLRKGKDVVDDKLAKSVADAADSLSAAKEVFEAIRLHFRWNEEQRFVSDGIKKAYEKGIGSSADINLALVAAYKHLGFNSEPVILSTRSNGLPTELFPVLTDFNYVIAFVNVGGQTYLLDATDDFLPFGVLPERCLNGKGRVMARKGSYWYEITPRDKSRQLTSLNVTLSKDGELKGDVTMTYTGYRAAEKRSKIYSFSTVDEYIAQRKNSSHNGAISEFEIVNLTDRSKPLVERFTIEFEPVNTSGGTFLFNPFLLEKIVRNPFRSQERLYPVDFGVPLDETVIVNVQLPDGITLDEVPDRVGIALPNSGGRYIFDVRQNGSTLAVNSSLAINRTVFSSEEYHYLKELFNRMISVNRMELVLKKL